jgi:erythronate-4-phosphate dehydrogenase
MKIIIDDKIPFIRGIFEPFASVEYLPGGAITKGQLKDAEVLIVRTRTRCDRNLLEGTAVRFIATATIGFDHIDTNYCQEQGIRWTNAPGCNSGSVAQYIASALIAISRRSGFQLKDKTLGIIGVGHVGSKVAKVGELLGMKVLLNDPPRARAEGNAGFTDLETLLRMSDIVTIHVPLNRNGYDKTFHLAGSGFLAKMKPGAILINSSRGEVVHEQEILRSTEISDHPLILDVWENEPTINRELLAITAIATPHIAGYSADGKWNATRMAATAAAGFLGIDPGLLPSPLGEVPPPPGGQSIEEYLYSTYDILSDDNRLRQSPETFEDQRNHYPIRREFQITTSSHHHIIK